MFDIAMVKAPSTRTEPPVMGTLDAHLALLAGHMDYTMRVHVTRWYGPTADHPGGRCKCYKGANLETPQPEPPQEKPGGRQRAREEDAVRMLMSCLSLLPGVVFVAAEHHVLALTALWYSSAHAQPCHMLAHLLHDCGVA